MDLVEVICDPAGVVVLTVADPAPDPDDLAQALRTREMFAATIRLQTGDTEEMVLRLLGRAFLFPTYYGVNWDAADECLLDMSWQPTRGYVGLLLPLSVRRPPPPRLVDQLAEIFEYAAEEGSSDQGQVWKLVLYPPLSRQ